MDILARIIEAVADKLISQKIDELSGDTLRSYIFKAEKSGPHQKGSNRAVGIAKAKYRSERLKSERNRHDIEPKEFKRHGAVASVGKKKPDQATINNQYGRSGSSPSTPMPLNGEKRGDSVNTSRGRGVRRTSTVEENIQLIAKIILEKKKGRCWKGYKPTPGVKPYAKGSCQPVSEGKSPAWQRSEGKNPEGGLNAKGRASAKAQGHNLKPPVSAEQAKKSKKSAGRRKSFCASPGTKERTLHLKQQMIQTQELIKP
jgi:Domain of unknown function (DUF6321)